MASRSKRPKKAVVSRKRASQPEVEFDTNLFRSAREHELFVKSYEQRQLIKGRSIDFNFFDREGFPFHSWFDRIGWTKLFTLHEFTYPRLVRLFYANLHTRENDVLASYVKGVPIMLTDALLARLISCPCQGLRLYESGKWPPKEVFPLNSACSLLTGDNSYITMPPNELFKPEPSSFTPIFRILHHMISYMLVPKGGHRNESSFPEIVLLWAIGSGTQLHLPFIIKQHMWHAFMDGRAQLPFDMLLTRIFHHFNVDLTGEEKTALRPRYDLFNAGTLHRMSIVKNNGVWSYLDVDPAAAEEELEEEAERTPAAPSGRPTPPRERGASSSSRSLNDEIRELRGEVRELRDENRGLRDEVHQLRAENHQIKETVTEFYTDWKGFREYFITHYRPSSPP